MGMGKIPHAALLASLGVYLILGWQPLAAQTPALSCSGTQRPKQVAELLFGRDIGHRLGVSESAFARFVAREITPRFADGLTIIDAIGQWRDPAGGALVREATKQIEIVLPGDADDQARLDAVAAAYKREFHQHSVGVIVRPACVSF
jgi:Protein of unknown function (DUF3574)